MLANLPAHRGTVCVDCVNVVLEYLYCVTYRQHVDDDVGLNGFQMCYSS